MSKNLVELMAKRCDTCASWCTDCPYLLRGIRAEECCQFWKEKAIARTEGDV